ncbi:MAG: ABC transporter permease, partial [Actinomycetota bacterium]|nr:ABC transporter permease [Actinomycetota bacterium]
RLLVSYLVTVLFLVTLNFFLPRAMPGDPISTILAMRAPTTEEDVVTRAELERYYGLDEPVVVQFGRYLGDLAQGDLGLSIRYRAPVGKLVRERLPWTLLLVGTAMAIATSAGLLAGIHSGWRRGRAVDRGMLSLFMGMRNFPVFFLGTLALFVFAVKLDWFPLSGASTPFSDSFGPLRRLADVAHHLVLPASVLAVQFTAGHYLTMRGSMVTQLGSDYLLLGRAKGLHERRLKYGYAARNALLPSLSLTAALASFAVSGSILVETVFAYQGMGRLLYESVGFRDYPTLQACFLVLTLVVLAANFLADLLYGRLDPRTVA